MQKIERYASRFIHFVPFLYLQCLAHSRYLIVDLLPLRQPLRSSRPGSALPHDWESHQGPQGDQEHEDTEAQPPRVSHQVPMGHDPGGVWLYFLSAEPMLLLMVSKDEKALKFNKKRMGIHTHSKRKREVLSKVLAAVRKAAAKKD